MRNSKDKKSKILIISLIIVILLTSLILACIAYINDYYRADIEMIEAYMPNNVIDTKMLRNDILIFEPENATTGFIFYPGGKVEYKSYIPLMKALASKGIMCVLIEMPCNLAILDINAADGIKELFTEIENWYIGGHSLGGSMASSYLAEKKNEFDGLILLGSYSTTNLNDSTLKVLSIYGSEDRVMNFENYKTNKKNLPSEFSEYIIEGGCHAYFGMYGKQDGDGQANISNEEQINQTASIISEFINGI